MCRRDSLLNTDDDDRDDGGNNDDTTLLNQSDAAAAAAAVVAPLAPASDAQQRPESQIADLQRHAVLCDLSKL